MSDSGKPPDEQQKPRLAVPKAPAGLGALLALFRHLAGREPTADEAKEAAATLEGMGEQGGAGQQQGG